MDSETLNRIFAYDPATGTLTWKVKSPGRGRGLGGIAGTKSVRGYWIVTVFGKKYPAHRLIWLMRVGSIAAGLTVDHIDGNKINNRMDNLRVCTLSDNQRNKAMQRNNKSGAVGVHPHKGGFKVQAAGTHVGWFKNIEKAIAARDEFWRANGFHPNHGRRAA